MSIKVRIRKNKSNIEEKLSPSMGAGAYVKDFYKSDAPQFKGKSKKKRREMAIAAYLDDKEEVKEEVPQPEEPKEQSSENNPEK